MRKLTSFALGTALVVLGMAVAVVPNCPAEAAKACVWHAAFYGERDNLFGGHDSINRVQCFSTQASCKAWLYQIQTAYPLAMNFTRCHR